MKKRQCIEEQIVRILQQVERGDQTIGAVCREHGIAEHTFAERAPSWRQKFGGLGIPETQRLREVEQEHARLKRLLAERRTCAVLRRDVVVNHKRVYRLWKRESGRTIVCMMPVCMVGN